MNQPAPAPITEEHKKLVLAVYAELTSVNGRANNAAQLIADFCATSEAKLNMRCEKLDYALNFLRLPLGIDTACQNDDTENILDLFISSFKRRGLLP